jgi:uncharacterized membrane protein YadS
LTLFGNSCLSAVSMKFISNTLVTLFMGSAIRTSRRRRMPAHGSPICTGSALEATSPTCLNRSNHFTILSAFSRKTSVCPQNVKVHLFDWHIACFCLVAVRACCTTVPTSVAFGTVCCRIVFWSCWGRSRNTRSWKFCCATVDVPEELRCEVEVADDAGRF